MEQQLVDDIGQPVPAYDSWFEENAPAPTSPAQTVFDAASAQAKAGAAAAATPQQAFNLDLLRQALLAYNVPASPAALKAFIAAHPEFAQGVTIGGSKGNKLYGPDGKFLADVIRGTSGPNPTWDWDESIGSVGGGETGFSLGGDFGSLAQRWNQSFHAPTADEIRQTPGYQFARDEGIAALDKTAAARGTVLNGGQKKDVMDFATGLADQTAQTKYQNALSEYMNSYNIFRNDNNDIFNRFDTLSNRGTQAALGATQ